VAVLVDTSVLIDHLRGDARATARLMAAVDAGHDLWSVAVVRTEILAGARPREREAIARLFDQLRWLDVTVEVADAAGRHAAQFIRSHGTIDTVDYLIAAGTEQLAAELLTTNMRDFPMFPELRPAY
jgi:predicted nucleic acid-binding protein